MIHSTFKTTKSILALSSILLITSVLQSAPFAYVADTGTPSINVIDVANNSSFTLFLPSIPQNGIAISPDAQIAYVLCYDPMVPNVGNIQRIALANNTLLSPILLGSNIQVNSIAITPDGASAYVTATDIYTSTGQVWEIDLASNTVVPTPITGFTAPTAIVIAPDGRTAYVLDTAAVIPIDLSNNTPQSPLTDLTTPTAIAVSPDGNYLYVYDLGVMSIQQYDISGSHNLTPNFLRSIVEPYFGTSGGSALIISQDGKTLYVSANMNPYLILAIDISNPSSPINSPTYLDLTSINDAPFAMAITPDNKMLYGTLKKNSQIMAADISNPLAPRLSALISPLSSGNPLDPAGIAITPLAAPSSISGCKTKNVFLLQTDYINKLTWSAPTAGTPTSYNIYRDAGLTDLAGTVPASGTLEFYDHGRNPNVTYTYYVTSAINGAQSIPASVTITSPC